MEEKKEAQKRQVAYKARIKDIAEGRYVKEEGWTPNYVITNSGRQISRANVIGVVVSKQTAEGSANHSSIIVDDGSGRISARIFEQSSIFDSVDMGDIVLMIGRPREFNAEMYIVPEIIKKVGNKDWLEVRRLELKKQDIAEMANSSPEIVKEVKKEEAAPVNNSQGVEEEVIEDIGEEINNTEKAYNLIRSLDKGDGVDYQEIVDKIGSEKEIETLLMEGEIYEVRPGKLKVL